jgi:hypothetical protein
MKSTFDIDLKRGKYYEEEVLNKIKTKYSSAHLIEGKCKEWDIFIPELNFGVEVKFDIESKKTGNIVVEIEFDGKPSALSTTKSEWWVWNDGDRYTWFKVPMIWKCINENYLVPRQFMAKGDTKYKKAYLIKKDLLYKYSYKKTNENGKA